MGKGRRRGWLRRVTVYTNSWKWETSKCKKIVSFYSWQFYHPCAGIYQDGDGKISITEYMADMWQVRHTKNITHIS